MPFSSEAMGRIDDSDASISDPVSVSVLPTPAIFAAPEESLPNILFIAIDDLRPALGCYGDTIAKSPRIDAFAKQLDSSIMHTFNKQSVDLPKVNPYRTSS